MKCLIAISVSREWSETDFMMQLGKWRMPPGWQVRFGWFRQFSAPERHNVSMNEAVFNYDRIIYMDTDQIYPPEYIEMLLAHNEPVVTALNVSRYQPYELTTYKITGEDVQYGVTVPKFEAMGRQDRKIYECDMTGTGSLMVDPKILSKIEVPYFKDVYDPTGCVRLVPDDFYFCWQLHKAGIKITVDQSIMVTHTAKVAVTPYNAVHLRKAWEAANSGQGMWKDGLKA